MDLLLVSPPVANVGQAAASISVLAAYLRARGWEVGQWDASIDAFHHFHSASYLTPPLTAEVDEARTILQSLPLDLAKMDRAFGALEAAGRVLSQAGREHTFRAFDIPRALGSWASLANAIADEASNPFVAWAATEAVPMILARSPRAVGLSFTYLSQIIPGLTLARALKLAAPELPLVVGGSYLTAVGDQAPQIPPEVLCAEVILHDGEAALDRWLSSTLRRAPANGADLRCVDLATVPSPCWIADGLDLSRYLVPRYAIPLPLTRGCHWGRCRYCNISAQTSSSYRARPIELAIADVRHAMVETGSDWFDLPTDSFRLDHLDHFARELVAQKLTVRWAAEVLMHPALTTEVIGRLARSGCCCLRFGMESASAQVLTAMNKPRPADLASRILRDCRAAGIRTSVMLIVGYPTETAHQRMETFEFLADHAACIDFVALHEFNLVPGSPMAADPSQFGLIALPSASVLAPALPYRNTNLVGLAQEHVHHAATAMRDALRDYYPQLGKPWAVAIGGWMTFAWCCLGAT